MKKDLRQKKHDEFKITEFIIKNITKNIEK